jgi:TolB protein
MMKSSVALSAILALLALTVLIAFESFFSASALAIIEWTEETAKGGARQPIWLEPFIVTGDAGRLDPMARGGESILVDDLFLSGHFRVDGPVAANQAPRGTEVARSKGPDLTAVVIGRLEPTPTGAKFIGRVLNHPNENLIFEREYPVAKEMRPVMHAFCDDIVRHLTGEEGIARTRIACICSASKAREVMVVDYDGYGGRQVTHDNSVNLAPTWSPVDALIAYASFKRGEVDLYGINPETGKGYDISHYPGIDSAPAWSPDGRFLAVTLAIKGNPDIYLIRRNGEIVERLTSSPGIDSSPCFSPTGRQIAFMSDRLGSPQIFVMDADGLNVTRLPIPHTYTDSPAWSPRGDRIAYAARLGAFDLFVTNLDGSMVTQLTDGQGSNENPRWAPDGRHIVFSSTRSGRRGVYVMLADGSNQRRLTPSDRDCFYPTWSPRPAAP